MVSLPLSCVMLSITTPRGFIPTLRAGGPRSMMRRRWSHGMMFQNPIAGGCSMRKATLAAVLVSAVALQLMAAPPFEYPKTKNVDQRDDYHGVKVLDPYPWLESDVRMCTDVAA